MVYILKKNQGKDIQSFRDSKKPAKLFFFIYIFFFMVRKLIINECGQI